MLYGAFTPNAIEKNPPISRHLIIVNPNPLLRLSRIKCDVRSILNLLYFHDKSVKDEIR